MVVRGPVSIDPSRSIPQNDGSRYLQPADTIREVTCGRHFMSCVPRLRFIDEDYDMLWPMGAKRLLTGLLLSVI